MRRRGFRFRRARRTVAWIPGLSCYDIGAGVSQTRLVGLTNVSTALFANVFGAAIALTIDSDLSMHGGEDAVLTRIVGRLGFTTGRVDSGAGAAATTFVARVVVAQTDFIPASGSVMPFEFLTSSGMGQDDILYMRDVIIPGTSVLEAAGATVPLGTSNDYMLDIDIKAKRKLQSDRQVVIWFQTAFSDVTVTSADFRMWGGLRMLLMRPR